MKLTGAGHGGGRSLNQCGFWLVFLGISIQLVTASNPSTSPTPTTNGINPVPQTRGANNPLWTAGRTDAIGGSGAIGSTVPKIKGLNVDCPIPAVQKYKGGKKCFDGTPAPKPLSRAQVDAIRVPWYHPANEESILHVQMVEQRCSFSCESGICYFSMNTSTFTCEAKGKKRSKDYKDAVRAFKDIHKFSEDSKKLGVGKICSRGPRRGMEYDPNLVTLADLAAVKWFVQTEGKEGIERMEKPLNKNCKRGDCELVISKGVFMCGGSGGQGIQLSRILPLLVILAIPLFNY